VDIGISDEEIQSGKMRPEVAQKRVEMLNTAEEVSRP
jgi:hypothetical protein